MSMGNTHTDEANNNNILKGGYMQRLVVNTTLLMDWCIGVSNISIYINGVQWTASFTNGHEIVKRKGVVVDDSKELEFFWDMVSHVE